ncbi:MAG: TIGR00304 family membrane protein [Thermoprotei archaeon]
MNLPEILLFSGLALIVGGFLLLFATSLRRSSEHKFEGGGVLIIGPIPIVFGTSQKISVILLVLAIALTLIALSTFILTSIR